MRIVPYLTLLTMVALMATAPVCRARDASAEIMPLEDKDIAKLDKEEVKRRRLERNLEDQSQDQSDGSQCGSVEIGNSNSSSQSATDRIAPHDTTVIVTGNVYNTASCGQQH